MIMMIVLSILIGVGLAFVAHAKEKKKYENYFEIIQETKDAFSSLKEEEIKKIADLISSDSNAKKPNIYSLELMGTRNLFTEFEHYIEIEKQYKIIRESITSLDSCINQISPIYNLTVKPFSRIKDFDSSDIYDYSPFRTPKFNIAKKNLVYN